jgi:hypothetical protein
VSGDDVRRFERFIVLDALVYPYASFELLGVAGGFNQWLFLLDDQYDHDSGGRSPARMREIVDRAFDTLVTGRLGIRPTPFHRFSAMVGSRIRARCSTRLWDRFTANVYRYLYEGSLVAISQWGAVLYPSEYRRIRSLDSSMGCVTQMVEMATESELDESTLADPRVAELEQLMRDHVSFLNDLASYHREVVQAGSTFNLVLCVATHGRVSIEEAVIQIAAELNATLDRFEELASRTSGAVRSHTDGLRCWISGNHRFSFHGGRYHHPEAHLVELRGAATDAPEPLKEHRIGPP